ncbi:MAG: hypothetical protein JSW72_00180, partial [Candidatus Bathyarchaeota archaeon]
KREEKKAKSTGLSLLERLCRDDTELLTVLNHSVLIDPARLREEGIDSYLKKAEGFEKRKDLPRARVNYQAAGELALYEGKLKQAQKFFKKCEELESNPEYKKIFSYYSKKGNAEKALETAQEYYSQTAKP